MKKKLALTGIISMALGFAFVLDGCAALPQQAGMQAAPSTVPQQPVVTGAVVPPDTDFEVTQNMDGKTLTISGYRGTIKGVIIPEKLYGLSVTVIAREAFRGKGLTSVTMPNSVTAIGSYAFIQNELTSIAISDSVTIIGSYAFDRNKLISVTIPDSVITIEADAFSNNQLSSVTLGRGLVDIGSGAFRDNQLASITIAKDTSSIGTRIGLEESFVNFYISQKRTPGTYVKNGPIWSKK
jgi:hypothetical protein